MVVVGSTPAPRHRVAATAVSMAAVTDRMTVAHIGPPLGGGAINILIAFAIPQPGAAGFYNAQPAAGQRRRRCMLASMVEILLVSSLFAVHMWRVASRQSLCLHRQGRDAPAARNPAIGKDNLSNSLGQCFLSAHYFFLHPVFGHCS
jgi:hypothetical protein